MTAYIARSAAQLNGAYKAHGLRPPISNIPGKTVDYSAPIKSCLKNGPKKTPEIAALLGLGAATAYRRLTALAEIGVVIRSKHRGLNVIAWSLPGAATVAAGAAVMPRRYVPTFQPGGRSEKEFYGHRDTAMAARTQPKDSA